MLDGIKKRLIHFESDGKSVVSDFVSARQRRVGALRRTVHACFYIQCAAALVCAVCGFAMGGIFTGLALAIGAAASVAAALMAVAGEPVIRLVSCALNLVYALICFIVSGNGAVFAACGFFMLAASAAAAVMPEAEPEPVEPAKPPEPSELMLIAEKVSGIMNSRSSRSAQENTTEVHSGESAQG